MLGRLLALLAALPVGLHLVGRGGEGAWLVVLLFAAPGLLGRAAGARSAEVSLLTALGGAFVTPLLPMLLGLDGFSAASVVLHGCLAHLAWTHAGWGARPAGARPGAGGLPAAARLLLLLWAAWSLGGALRGLWAYQPAGAPWLADALLALVLDPFGYAFLVDPVRPLGQLLLRLETLAFLWASLEVWAAVAAREQREPAAEGPVQRLLVCLRWIVLAGVVVGLAELVAGSAWRGDASVIERLRVGLGRNMRPLLDHNALGTVLVVLVPLQLLDLSRSLGRRALGHGSGPVLFSGLALAAGLGLLVSSRSKSALAGVGLAVVVLLGVGALRRGGGLRRAALGLGGLVALLVVGLNLAPTGPGSLVEGLSSSRYGEDLVRVVRLDAARDYLAENRVGVWRRARAVGAEHPLVGVGLGRLPLLLAEHHDPADPSWFNPTSENAHSQYLQWAAEEGLVGLALGLGLLGLAFVAGLRRGDGLGLAGAAAVAGLALNLTVGHALLVPAAAVWVAGLLGLLLVEPPGSWEDAELGGASRSGSPSSATRVASVFGGVALLALAPLALPGGRRPLPLEDHTFGCSPWSFLPGQVPDRGRSVGPDARWFQVWGAGELMKLPVRDARDPRFSGQHRLRLELDGEVVVEDFLLPHRDRAELEALAREDPAAAVVNPQAFLRVRRPAGVVAGQLVELRLSSSDYFVGSRAFSTDHRRFAAWLLPAFFQDPRPEPAAD